MSTTWFDLASPRRQRLSVTGRPADALFAATVAFGPGECPSSDGLVLADTSAVPFAVQTPTYHPDGSLAHCTIRWADRESLNPGADRLLALYYGGPAQPGGNDLMAWEEAARAIRTPVYTATFDEAGRLGSLVLTGVGQEMLGEGGLLPAICLPGGSGWLGLEPGGEPVVSVTPAAVVAEVRYRWEGIHATCRFTFLPTHIRVTYETAGLPDGAALLPLAARLRQHAGYLIGPGDWRGPLNQSGQTVDRQGPLTLPGFHLSSQSGLVCLVNGADRPCDRFVYDDTCPSGALVGVGYSRAGAAAGEVLLIPTPFNGAATLEHAGRLAERFGGAGPTASVVPGAAEARPAALHVQAGDGLRLEAGPLTLGASPAGGAFRLELSAAGRPLMTTDRLYRLDTPGGQAAAAPHFACLAGETLLLAAELTDREGNHWALRSQFRPRLIDGEFLFAEHRSCRLAAGGPVAAGLGTAWTTPVGPPRWHEGESTVFIPGMMARGNAHPDQPHGGGPKWGPSPEPARCPHCKEPTPGHCDHWSFPASRLPNPWVAAADATIGIVAAAGTLPRSDLGETGVGFAAPVDGTVELRLYTPGVYEPWIPLGYGRMAAHPRRDRARVAPGQTVAWQLYYGGQESRDLNGWAGFDRALYHLCAPLRGAPYKLERLEALRLLADRLYRAHYHPEHGLIAYADFRLGNEGLGFTGMGQSALTLLMAGDLCDRPQWRRAGLAVLDRIAGAMLDAPDFPFAYIGPDGYQGGGMEPGYVIMCGLDNLQQALRFEAERGVSHPGWLEAIRRASLAWVKHQRADGAFPHRHPAMDPAHPEVVAYESTNVEAGVMGCLVESFRLTREPAFLEAAGRAAAYYGRLLDEGKLYGGPGDIEALVNSEVPMWYLRGFLRLWQATGDEGHRRWALASAAWRFAFQFSHSWPVDFGSPLYRQGWSGVGGEGASASNLHMVAFGAMNLDDYQALYLATGDPYVLDRYADLLHYATEQFARFEGDLGLPEGASCESFWASDSLFGKGYVKVFDFAGLMAWVAGFAGLGLAGHLLRERSGGDSR